MTTVLPLVLSKLELKVPVFVLTKYYPLPAIQWGEFRQYVCSKQDLLSHLKGLQIGIFRFWQKETGVKRVALARAPRVSFCFTCDVHFWCTFLVSHAMNITAPIFQEIFLIQYFTILVAQFTTSSLSNLHNTKALISLEQKQMCQKGRRHSAVFFKSFQISSNYFSFHRHFNNKYTWE